MSRAVIVHPVQPQPVKVNDDFDGTWEWLEPGHYYDDLTMAFTLNQASPYKVGQIHEGRKITSCDTRHDSWLSIDEQTHKPQLTAHWWWLVFLED